jgi:hypothetical protein
MTTDGFFAVGKETFKSACHLGMNPACALLVMASGTGKDNVTTKWSAEAVSTHVGVRWSTAKEAINALLDLGIVTLKPGKSTRPIYKLSKDGDLIWLPRSLIEGAANEVPPITKVRQTQDAMMLRLLVDLYSAQNLREDGGVRADVYCEIYDRRQAGQQAAYTVWDFTKKHKTVSWNDLTRPHWREFLTDKEEEDGKNKGVDFFARVGRLESLGLIDWVPYLFEGEKGEPIHALTSKGLPIEQRLYEAATSAAERMLTFGQTGYVQGVLVPVLAHIDKVQLKGLLRLRYRPHTRLTAAWWAEHHAVCQGFIDRYETLAVPVTPAAPKSVPEPQSAHEYWKTGTDDRIPF